MLEPDQRQVLLADLQPPPGHQLDAAVATTFTLSLQAALIPALAFSTLRLDDETRDPVVLLESIKRISDRVDVFCQAGCIAVPSRRNDLFTFLEPMIHQVAPPRGALFHPKLWFLRFSTPTGEMTHRLLVLTRNLTGDNTWDIIVRLDSTGLAADPIEGNFSLAELIRSLPQRATGELPAERRDRIKSLAHDAARVVWERPTWAESLTIHTDLSSVDLHGRRVLAISPFVDDVGITNLRAREGVFLVSRPGQMDALSADARRGVATFVINPAAGDDRIEPDEAAPPDAPSASLGGLTVDLHAKLYVLEPLDGRSRTDRLLVGSANATNQAFTRNTELLLEFTGRRHTIGIDAILGHHVGAKGGALENFLDRYHPGEVEEPDLEDEVRRELENWLRSVAAISHRVDVAPAAGNGHSITISADRAYPTAGNRTVSVGLLTLPGRERRVAPDGTMTVAFEGVETPDITAYVTVRVLDPSGISASTVVVATLQGAPDDRFDQVLARQIDTKDKFLRLLHLLLGMISATDFVAGDELAADPGGSWGASGARDTGGELELVLSALATDPRSLLPIDDLVRRLAATDDGRSVLPDGFEVFWDEVRTVLPKGVK